MLLTRAWIFPSCMLALGAGTVSGQDYPSRPLHIITTGVGGAIDFTARLIAQGISAPLGQPVIVDNRASVIVSAELVAKAAPDGYSLLVMGGSLWIGPLLEKLSYDALRDFAPVTAAGITPNVLVVHPSLPARSVRELIALARAKPASINYASSITGGSIHLATELLKSMAGVKIERISYKNTGQAINDLIGGQVQLMFGNGPGLTPHIKSGRLRALAVTTAQPSALFPGLPTVAASLPGYESVLLIGVFAPGNTPAAVIKRLNEEIVRVLNTASVKEKFFNAGSEVAGGSPEQLSATIKSEIVRMGKVIKDAGIRAD